MEPPTLVDVAVRRAHIYPSATVSPLAVIGSPAEWRGRETLHDAIIREHAKVMALVTVDAGVQRPTIVGAHTLLMKHCHVGHDAEIGVRCEISPGACIGGLAELGNDVRVGMNAVILPAVKVGDRCVIGAGAIVTRDVPAGLVVVGNPGRAVRYTDGRSAPGCVGCSSPESAAYCIGCERIAADRLRA